MSIFQAIILGAVQGLTEFIPVSSSGHLIAVPVLFHWHPHSKAFDAAIHLGTLAALLIYYRREWIAIMSGFLNHVIKKQPYTKDENSGASGRLMVPIIVACIPAAVVGILWDDFFETQMTKWYYVAPALVVFGILMWVADRWSKKQRNISHMNYTDYITIGLAQALALFPGVSRSGATITAGLFRNLDREAAARFSFLLSTPVILGAGLVGLKHVAKNGFSGEFAAFIWGLVSAAIFGYIAIHFLIKFLQKNSVAVFTIYRILLAVALVVVFLARG